MNQILSLPWVKPANSSPLATMQVAASDRETKEECVERGGSGWPPADQAGSAAPPRPQGQLALCCTCRHLVPLSSGKGMLVLFTNLFQKLQPLTFVFISPTRPGAHGHL